MDMANIDFLLDKSIVDIFKWESGQDMVIYLSQMELICKEIGKIINLMERQ